MDLLSYCYQIASGMSFLSSKNVRANNRLALSFHHSASFQVVHRDLALRNVLLTDRHIVKVSDFGLAFQDPHKTGSADAEEAYLPMKWMAPEAIECGKFTTEGDM